MKLMKLYFLIFTRRHIRWYSAYALTHTPYRLVRVCVFAIFARQKCVEKRNFFGCGHTYIPMYNEHTTSTANFDFVNITQLVHCWNVSLFLSMREGVFGNPKTTDSIYHACTMLASLNSSATNQKKFTLVSQTPIFFRVHLIPVVRYKIFIIILRARTRKQWIFVCLCLSSNLFPSQYLMRIALCAPFHPYSQMWSTHTATLNSQMYPLFGNNHNWWWVGMYRDIAVVFVFSCWCYCCCHCCCRHRLLHSQRQQSVPE